MLIFTFFDGAEWPTIGTSERVVSEEAYKTQQKLKDDYMQRDQKHMETISELRKQLEEKQDYIKILEKRITSQRITIKVSENNKLDAILKCSMYRKDIESRNDEIEKLQNENKVLKARLKNVIGIDYTDSTDYIACLHNNVLNQRKELRNLNKALERERKRNGELEELYSSAQKDVCMLNLKVMELNQGIRDSTDLTWKEKYDELEAKYMADSTALNDIINELRKRLKQ